MTDMRRTLSTTDCISVCCL